MNLQKSTTIALCSILEAALDPDRQITSADIAEKYGVSLHHLSKVLRRLGRAGLLKSSRGVGGGYRFAGNAKRVTLMDIIDLFEDMIVEPSVHRKKEYSTDVERSIAQVLVEIDETAKAVFKSITVATMLRLIERQNRISNNELPPKFRLPRDRV